MAVLYGPFLLIVAFIALSAARLTFLADRLECKICMDFDYRSMLGTPSILKLRNRTGATSLATFEHSAAALDALCLKFSPCGGHRSGLLCICGEWGIFGLTPPQSSGDRATLTIVEEVDSQAAVIVATLAAPHPIARGRVALAAFKERHRIDVEAVLNRNRLVAIDRAHEFMDEDLRHFSGLS